MNYQDLLIDAAAAGMLFTLLWFPLRRWILASIRQAETRIGQLSDDLVRAHGREDQLVAHLQYFRDCAKVISDRQLVKLAKLDNQWKLLAEARRKTIQGLWKKLRELEATRCLNQCPHGDRCTLGAGHDGGCNHRGCDCNEPDVTAPDEVRDQAEARGWVKLDAATWAAFLEGCSLSQIEDPRAEADAVLLKHIIMLRVERQIRAGAAVTPEEVRAALHTVLQKAVDDGLISTEVLAAAPPIKVITISCAATCTLDPGHEGECRGD